MRKLNLTQQHLVEAAGERKRVPYVRGGCALHTHTSGDVPATLELHHRFPLYLQARVWSDVDPSRMGTAHDKERIPVCGNGHSDVHLSIDNILNPNASFPHMPKGVGHKEWEEAEESVRRYQDARVAAG